MTYILLVKKYMQCYQKTKITNLLQEVDSWVNYMDAFTHLKSDKITEKLDLLQTVILYLMELTLDYQRWQNPVQVQHIPNYHRYKSGIYAKKPTSRQPPL